MAGAGTSPAASASAPAPRARRRGGAGRTARPRGAAQAAATKSCAAWPTASSGEASPTLARIGRDSQGPGSVAGGQTPSTRPPSTSTSDGLQPRLQQAPDEHARMLACRRGRAGRGGCAPPRLPAPRPAGPGSTARRWSGSSGSAARTSARAVASASPSSPAQSRAGPGVGVGGGEALGGVDQRGQRLGGGDLDRGGDAQGRLQAGFQPAQQVGGLRWRRAARSSARRRPVRPGRRARAAQAALVPAPGRRRGRRRATGRRRRAGASAAPAAAPAPVPRRTARASRRRNTAGGVSAKGSPALSSATTPWRSSSAATRPASSRSGVTSAARAPGVSRASRRTRAMAAASSCWSAGLRRVTSVQRWRRVGAPGVQRLGRQQRAAERGEALWRHRRCRLHWPGPHVAARRAEAGQQAAQAGLRMGFVQRVPGRLVHRRYPEPAARPARCGSRATTRSRRATAGMPPVVPATSTGSIGRSAFPRRRPARSAARPGARPGSSGRSRPASSGQAAVTMCRNCSVRAQCAA